MLFPRINGFVLIPNEVGALVGLISWIGVEMSQYPKQKGYKDFDLIDLPFPLRKMSVTPMGTLKNEQAEDGPRFKLERGVYSFPSIGDSVVLPTDSQLRAIVENDDEKALVHIGNAPVAANAAVRINPDKFFGRHVAILGNTGSGKSCSVAGVIRWSLESAASHLKNEGQAAEGEAHKESAEGLNTRFIVLDPNGEYTDAFNGLNAPIKKFRVEIDEESAKEFKEMKVPAWLWNSYEWSSFSSASAKTQRPILRQALRELKSDHVEDVDKVLITAKRYFASLASYLRRISSNPNEYQDFPGKQNLGQRLEVVAKDTEDFAASVNDEELNLKFTELAEAIEKIWKARKKGQYYNPFAVQDVDNCLQNVRNIAGAFGGLQIVDLPNEDAPIVFDVAHLPERVESIADDQNARQHIDYLAMRLRSMLSDARMNQVVGGRDGISLDTWLGEFIDGICVIDLSLVPSEITHLVVSVISRIVFETLQRYRRANADVLPTVIVMEEAHNFIRRYNTDNEEISATRLCAESFEKIAREGRKFGLSLALSSQRPSELSPTVLSQCNTFLLHRIVNDKDQELVGRLVPDNISGLLRELPVLPTRKAILLGWATPIPVLVEMNDLAKEHQPKSSDPDFWDVWTRKSNRAVDWKQIADDWQGVMSEDPSDASSTNSTNGDDDIPS